MEALKKKKISWESCFAWPWGGYQDIVWSPQAPFHSMAHKGRRNVKRHWSVIKIKAVGVVFINYALFIRHALSLWWLLSERSRRNAFILKKKKSNFKESQQRARAKSCVLWSGWCGFNRRMKHWEVPEGQERSEWERSSPAIISYSQRGSKVAGVRETGYWQRSSLNYHSSI